MSPVELLALVHRAWCHAQFLALAPWQAVLEFRRAFSPRADCRVSFKVARIKFGHLVIQKNRTDAGCVPAQTAQVFFLFPASGVVFAACLWCVPLRAKPGQMKVNHFPLLRKVSLIINNCFRSPKPGNTTFRIANAKPVLK